jgi:hypothetical protein
MKNMIYRLRSYQNGVHGPFFLEVADRLEELTLRVQNQEDKYRMHYAEGKITGRAEALEQAAQLMEIQSPHLFCDPDKFAADIRALAESV